MIRSLIIVCLVLIGGSAFAQSFVFDGRVEAVERGELASPLDGRVAQIRFNGGETVAVGQPLIELDKADFEFDVSIAGAELAEARARLAMAQAEADRAEALSDRGVGTVARRQDASAVLAAAQAAEAAAVVRLQKAEFDLARATIRAPIAGIVSRPNVAVGSFVEAKAGEPLATIMQLDPVLVAYQVPYGDRLAALAEADAETVEALFDRVVLTLLIVDGQRYALPSQPAFASADVSPETGMLSVWARFDNPDLVLRPGMAVRVQSTIIDQTE